MPPDTEWVKRVKIRSRILSEWWGHPMHLGAVVLLPRGYDDDPGRRYPVIFEADHFRLEPAFGFTTEPPSGGPGLFDWMWRDAGGMRESGYDFQRAWTGDDFPRVIAVTIQHPTPFFDDSYGVNSANNGPYGDAIHQELIPYLEENFRMIGEPWARVITGGSTGGWIALAWQVRHPTFYGGTWTFYPDSVDFRRLPAHRHLPGRERVPRARRGARRARADVPADHRGAAGRQRAPAQPARAGPGLARALGRADRRLERRLGPPGRRRLPAAAMGPRDGRHRPRGGALHCATTATTCATTWRENWPRIGPDLVGKIHVYNPEMDQFYLTYAVYLLEEFLEGTTDPHYGGEFVHGRPMKGHLWSPFTNADLVRRMADHVARNAPAGASLAWRAGNR